MILHSLFTTTPLPRIFSNMATHPDNRAASLAVPMGIYCGLTLTGFCLRLYTRISISKSLGIDDAFLVLTVVRVSHCSASQEVTNRLGLVSLVLWLLIRTHTLRDWKTSLYAECRADIDGSQGQLELDMSCSSADDLVVLPRGNVLRGCGLGDAGSSVLYAFTNHKSQLLPSSDSRNTRHIDTSRDGDGRRAHVPVPADILFLDCS